MSEQIEKELAWFFRFDMPENVEELGLLYVKMYPLQRVLRTPRKIKLCGKWYKEEAVSFPYAIPSAPPWEIVLARWIVLRANGYEPEYEEMPF